MTTMKDVAKRAGVSVGTVSRYINQMPGLKEKTRLAVEKVIKELNYVPDEYAKGMKTQNTQTIVLLIPTVWHPFFTEFAYYVEQALSNANYKMLLCNSDHDPQKEQRYVKMVVQNKVDGIIGITYNDLGQNNPYEIPFVSIDRYFENKTSLVASDNFDGGRQAAEAMLKTGSKHLMYFGDYSHFKNDTTNRREGFRQTVKAAGASYDEIFEKEPLVDIDAKIQAKLRQNPAIDGIFCVTDTMAQKVLSSLRKLHIAVPEQIQIVGYDGAKMAFDDESEHVSTIAQPIQAMAQKAVEVILDEIKNKSAKKVVLHLPVKFQKGFTTR